MGSTKRVRIRGATLAAGLLLAAACGDDEKKTSDTAICSSGAYPGGPIVDDFCGCTNAYIACSAKGESVTRDACVCVSPDGECSTDLAGLLFCGPERSAYQCRGGAFARALQCPGTGRCIVTGHADIVTCGTDTRNIDYAIEDEPCASEQGAACTLDQSKVLTCQAGVWVTGLTCSSGVTRCEVVTTGCPGGQSQCLSCGRL